MSENEVTVASIDVEIEDTFHSLRRELGVASFGMNLIELEPRQRNRVHVHERQEEVYLVIEGTLTIWLEDRELTLEQGMVARVPPSVRRQIGSRGPAPVTVLALGGYGEHEARDALAWTDWDEGGDGRSPKEVPLPGKLPEGRGNDGEDEDADDEFGKAFGDALKELGEEEA